MSVYRCNYCDQYKDADFDDCIEDPRDECECICDSCAERLEYQAEILADSMEEENE